MYVWVLNPQTDVQIIFSRAYASVTLFKFWHHFPKSNKTTKSSHLTTDGCLTKVTKTSNIKYGKKQKKNDNELQHNCHFLPLQVLGGR